jgi:hypothetical protein
VKDGFRLIDGGQNPPSLLDLFESAERAALAGRLTGARLARRQSRLMALWDEPSERQPNEVAAAFRYLLFHVYDFDFNPLDLAGPPCRVCAPARDAEPEKQSS